MRWQSGIVPAVLVTLLACEGAITALPIVGEALAPEGTRLLGQTPPERTTSSFTLLAFPSTNHSFLRVSLHTVGGALVGGWAGYVGAQVAWSDWRDEPGRRAQRVRFSVAGAAIGLVAGFVIGTRTPPAARRMRPVSLPGQGALTENEIRASTARSLSQLLRETRPQWLRSRGADVLAPNPDPLRDHGVRVYLNGELLGGLETLDEVLIYAVTRIEFLDGTAAVLRWGAGNDDGAILLTTRPSE